MLMVTTTVWMFNRLREETEDSHYTLTLCLLFPSHCQQSNYILVWLIPNSPVLTHVHGHTTDFRPRVSFDLVLVVSTASFQQWFVDPTSSCDHTHHSSTRRGQSLRTYHKLMVLTTPDICMAVSYTTLYLLWSRRKLDPCLSCIWILSNDGGIVSWCLCKLASVTGLFFDSTNDGPLGHGGQRKTVTDRQRCYNMITIYACMWTQRQTTFCLLVYPSCHSRQIDLCTSLRWQRKFLFGA